MELQTLAFALTANGRNRFRAAFPRLTACVKAGYGDDLLLVLALCTAAPSLPSLAAGGSLIAAAAVLAACLSGYQALLQAPGIVGPFRFVRHPAGLAYYLFWIGMALACRSFFALICSLGVIPFFLHLFPQPRANPISDFELCRYRQYTPALVPTLFPYHALPGMKQSFSWRRALLRYEGPRLRLLVMAVFAAAAALAVAYASLPSWSLYAAAGGWIGLRGLTVWLRRARVL